MRVFVVDWRDDCTSSGRMKNSVEIPHPSPGQRVNERNKHDMVAADEVCSWTVNVECSVAADIQRIFYALTVPEYIETWFCVPGCSADCRNVTCHVAQGFQIDHHCNPGATRITGTYHSFLTRKLSFSWKLPCMSSSQESRVDIRLYGDFQKSVLKLRHFGLASEEEFKWHLALWSASVDRLCKLFEKPALTRDQPKIRERRRTADLPFAL